MKGFGKRKSKKDPIKEEISKVKKLLLDQLYPSEKNQENQYVYGKTISLILGALAARRKNINFDPISFTVLISKVFSEDLKQAQRLNEPVELEELQTLKQYLDRLNQRVIDSLLEIKDSYAKKVFLDLSHVLSEISDTSWLEHFAKRPENIIYKDAYVMMFFYDKVGLPDSAPRQIGLAVYDDKWTYQPTSTTVPISSLKAAKRSLRQFKSEVQHHLTSPRIPHEESDTLTIFSVDD